MKIISEEGSYTTFCDSPVRLFVRYITNSWKHAAYTLQLHPPEKMNNLRYLTEKKHSRNYDVFIINIEIIFCFLIFELTNYIC